MRFKEWKIWVGQKPWLLRWFIFLVLLRPLIDSLYFLKSISPLVSPPYLVGLLTPFVAMIAIAYRPQPTRTAFDKRFVRLAIFMGIGIIMVVWYDPFSLVAIENLLKLSLPIVLYFFLRRFIETRRDLDGLLTTFLYSTIFVALTLGYELTLGPIRIEESRGFERIQGNFGDVVSYGIYIVFSFLVITYFYFSRTKVATRKRMRNVAIVGAVCVLGLFNIHHIASYLIFASLLALFFLFNLRTNRNAAFLMAMLAFGVFAFYGQDLLQDRIAPLFETDQKVLAGEADVNRLAHGRVGRWQEMWETYTDQHMVAQFFGYPTTLQYPYSYVGSGAHNDFMRLLFLSGYFGLFCYLAVLWAFFQRSRKVTMALRYLTFGMLGILVLFSMSITPTFYPPFMYLVMAIFAYIALPQKRVVRKNG